MKAHIPILDTLDFSHPLPKVWKGATGHIGEHRITPVVERMSNKTKCATVTAMAGVLIWGATRLKPFVKTAFALEFAEACFAWQYDWRYINPKAAPYYAAPDEPKEVSAILVLIDLFRNSMWRENDWKNGYAPVMQLYHMRNVVKYIMLPNKLEREFSKWMEALLKRLTDIASAEYESHDESKNSHLAHLSYKEYCDSVRGNPLPPMVLDLDRDISGYDLDKEAKKFLQSLDHTKNRYLKSPEEMAAMGFEGEPYK